MISVYQMKPGFQKLLRPLVKTLAGAGITANQVTVFALLLSLSAALFVCLTPYSPQQLLVLPVTWLIRMALNAIDGMLAREHDQASALGCFLNETCDIVADVVLFLPLLLIPELSSPLVLTTLFLFVLTEVVGLIAPQIGASRRYDGPLGKSDRALIISVFILLFALIPDLVNTVNGLMSLLAVLSLVTIAQRIRKAIEEVRHV